MADVELPRESVEFLPVKLEVLLDDGTQTVAPSEYQLVQGTARPVEDDWQEIEEFESMSGFFTDGVTTPGTYAVYVRVIGNPEIPVVKAFTVKFQ